VETCPKKRRRVIARGRAVDPVGLQRQNGRRFWALWTGDDSLYKSPSEADLALCRILSFYTGCDAARIDRLFRESGLMREKWERDDYSERTIAKAIALTGETYSAGAHW
jgi:putative DNA primase/helicase